MMSIEKFGKDHWSTFAYLDYLAVNYKGLACPDRRKMRTDGKAYPTVLKNKQVISNHNDYDCCEDLEHYGLLENKNTGTNPAYRFTNLGNKVMAQLNAHKKEGGNFGDFIPEFEVNDEGV